MAPRTEAGRLGLGQRMVEPTEGEPANIVLSGTTLLVKLASVAQHK